MVRVSDVIGCLADKYTITLEGNRLDGNRVKVAYNPRP